MLLSLWSEKKREGREQMQPRDVIHSLPLGGDAARKNEYEPADKGTTRVCVVAAKFSCNPRYDVSPGLDF